MRSARLLVRPSRGSCALAAAAVLAAGVIVPLVSDAASAAPAATIDQVQAEIEALQTQSEAATEAYDAGRISLANAKQAAAAADASVARQSAALAAQTAGARQLAAAEYRDGGIGKLLTFVGSGNPAAFLEQASTLSSISTSQAAQIQALQAAAKRLADAKTLDAAKQVAASNAATKLAADLAHVQSLIGQQETILANLKAEQRAELLARQEAADRAAAAAAASQRAAAEKRAQEAAAQQAAAAAAAPANTTAVAVAATTSVAPTTSDSSAAAPAPVAVPVAVPASDRASVALSAAYSQVGKPYVYGGSGPSAYDCSGLTMWAFARAGIALPHSAAAQYGYGTHVSRSELEPGDLVFFNEGGGIGHVGIYAGSGTMVDAPHSGSSVGVHALYPGFVGGTRL